MTTYNNYDCNSKGLNIEAQLYYSNYFARDWFEENFKRLGREFRTTKEWHYIYIDWGNLPADDIIDDNERIVKILDDEKTVAEKIFKYLVKEEWYTEAELEEEKDDMYALIELGIDTIYDSTFDDAIFPIEELLMRANINFKSKYTIVYSRGYCQGDYAEVLVFEEELKKVWGADKINMESLEKEIHHLLWDSPLMFRVEINGHEWCESDLFDTVWITWDENTKEDAIIKIIETLPEELKPRAEEISEELNEILPDDAEYLG